MPRPIHTPNDPGGPADAALRLSEATRSAILETALDCIITIDHQGCVIDFNPAAEQTFGYTRAEALGREMGELIVPPHLRSRHRDGMGRAVSTGRDTILGQRIEITAMRKSGEEFPVELAITRIRTGGAPVFTGHIRDITARKRAEERRAAELSVIRVLAQAATLAEAAPQILQAVCESLRWDVGTLWRVDRARQLLRCVNIWHTPAVSAAAFVAATRAGEFLRGAGLPGRIWAAAEPQWIPDVTQDANFPRAALAAENGLHSAFGFPIRLGKDVLGVIEFFSREIRQPNADVLEMFSAIGSQIGQFIERNEAEEAMYRMNKDLERRVQEATAELRASQERLHAALEQEKELSRLKSNFVTLVSHEFRTPLGVILSSAQILETYSARLKPEQHADHLRDIQESARHMAALMEEVLLLGRVEAGRMECRPEPLSVREFCGQLVGEILAATQSVCPIEFSAGRLPARAAGDAALVRHIFTNLLSNAVKYSSPGSAVQFAVERDGRDAVFRVADHGIGIPEADLKQLFESFHRGGNVGEIPGTGLGMVLVKRCVELHRGDIAVESVEGRGTTVTVRLPLFEK
jgi:PAS domain S-box-containing protein